jgi:hypothetical protein
VLTDNQRAMESLSHLLKELEPLREVSTQEACQGFVSALWRRTEREIAELSIHFADAGMSNLAAMCRNVAAAKSRK